MPKVTTLFGAGFLLFWAGMWGYTANLNLVSTDGTWSYNPLFYPNLIIKIGLGLSLILLALSVLGRVPDQITEQTNFKRVFTAMLGICAYLLLLVPLGFILDSILFLSLFGAVMGYRRFIPLLLTSVGATLIIYLVFTQALRAPLPNFPISLFALN